MNALDKERLEKPGTAAAKQLLGQIDCEKGTCGCAFWVVSAIHKIAQENPKMTMTCLRNIIRDNMPKAFAAFHDYLKHT